MRNMSRLLHAWITVAILLAFTLGGCSSEDSASPPATPNYTPEEIQEMIIQTQDENDMVLGDLLEAGMDTVAAMDSVLVRFLEDPDVAWGEVGGQGIAVRYANGMIGGIFVDPADDPESDLEFPDPDPGPALPGKTSAADPELSRAILLSAHYHERAQYTDAIIGAYDWRLGAAGFDTLQFYKNNEVTLDALTHLTGYRIVHFYSHGWAWPSSDNIEEVYLMTGEYWTAESHLKYWNDIENGDLPLVRIHGGTDQFFISPAFIHKYNSLSNKTLVYGGFCYSGLGSWPEYMVEHAGAGGYVGFDWSVLTRWNAGWSQNLILDMLNPAYDPALVMNQWYNSSLAKAYVWRNRVVHLAYTGDRMLRMFDTEETPCNETEEEHDDVWVHARVSVLYPNGAPHAEMPVRVDYRKIHCDGHVGGIDPVFGETGLDGEYSAGTVASFHLDNTQDLIVVRATVGAVQQEKIYQFSYFNGFEGSSLFFPVQAEFTFHF